MKRICGLAALAVLVFAVENASACTFAPGYFHQVTRLQGRVVGRSLGPVQFRWLRRMFPVSGAELIIYDYNQPFGDPKPPVIARVNANSSGEFAFGKIPEGHYRLEITGRNLHGFFDVEVTKKAPETKTITIDVSPVSPDCSGGHEFEVEAKEK